MLNTGLAIRQPHDSLYSRLRCFFMSNWGLSLSTIKQELRRVAPPGLMPRPGQLVTLVEQYQRQFCERHGIIYVAAEPFPLTAPIRTCPRCAAMGYHTAAFQWPWVIRCPVHHVALTNHCPVCRHAWPTVLQLARCGCPGCGWRSRYDLAAGATVGERGRRAISWVVELAQSTPSPPPARLVSATPRPYAQNEHIPLAPPHPLFASSYGSCHPRRRLPLLTLGARFSGMLRRRFSVALSRRSRDLLLNPDNLAPLDQLVRDRVAARIRRAIAPYCGQRFPLLTHMDIEFDGIDQHTNCYLFAYVYWCRLVKDRARGAMPPGYPSRYFELNGEHRYPLMPIPMDYLEFGAGDSPHETAGPTAAKQLIPLGMRHLIYECDLWLCFKHILTYFDALKAAQEYLGWSSLYKRLPSGDQGSRPYAEGLAVYHDTPKTLLLVLPRSYCCLTFDDLGLYESSPLGSSRDRSREHISLRRQLLLQHTGEERV